MADYPVEFTLSYSGGLADETQINLYDVAQALIGFQRSLALTTHLILNGEIITKAPYLRGAQILATPPEDGSWQAKAIVAMIGVAAYNLGTAPKDTPIGNLMSSAYDYVVSEALGFHVDYDKTLGQQYKELHESSGVPELQQSNFDSLIEKCEKAIEDMHRPIIWSGTAFQASIVATIGRQRKPIQAPLNLSTYEYIHVTNISEAPEDFTGRVSSYNINTYKGRVYLHSERRPIPFELGENARSMRSISRITASLTANAQSRFEDKGDVRFAAFRRTSKTGRLKALLIVEIYEE